MKPQNLALSVLVLSATAAATATAFQGRTTPAQVAQSDLGLLFAQPYVLDEAYQHDWRADRPTFSAGFLVVVSADGLLPPRQVHNPLLFAGAMPLERLNDGSQTGVYIGLLPAPLGADGQPALDLAEVPLYWAKPDILPESLRPADAERVLTGALDTGAAPQDAAVLDRALAEGGGTIYLPSYGMLRRYSADVIERFSSAEVDLISGLRAPLLK